MTTPKNRKEFNPAWLLLPGCAIILTIAVIAFLFTKDGIAPYQEITGWEALKLQWPSFWKWVIFLTIAGIIFAWLGYANEVGAWPAARWPGNTGLTISLFIVSLACLFGPWGKACTDKTNGGVTAPSFKKDNQVIIIQGDSSKIVLDSLDEKTMKEIKEVIGKKLADTTKY